MKSTAIAMVSFLALTLIGTRAQAQESLPPGTEIPSFTLRTVNSDVTGKRLISIDDYFGEGESTAKIVVMSFFATYCKPCKRELPFLEALWQTYKDKGLQIFVVSIDREQEKVDELKALSDKHKLTFPVLWDRFNIVAKRYAITKLPCLYMVAPDRRISMVNVGYNHDISHKLLASIRQAIGVPLDEPLPDTLKEHVITTVVAASSSSDESTPAHSSSNEPAPASDSSSDTAHAKGQQPAAAPQAPTFSNAQQKLIAFAEQMIDALENQCGRPAKCLKAFNGLSKRPARQAKKTLRKLKKKGEISDALRAKLQEIKARRDQLISENNALAKNKRLKKIVKRLDKTIGI